MSGSRGHVFVVDDDASFLAAICRLIEVSGFHATGVTRPAELYTFIPFPEGSCILADIILGRESGLDIPEALKKLGENTPVIFMSATDDPEILAAAGREGSMPCLRKPFDANELLNSIEHVSTLSPDAVVQEFNPRKDNQ